MPPLDSSMVLTIKTPIAILLIVMLLIMIVFILLGFLEGLLQVKTLTARVEELNTELESSKNQQQHGFSIQETYLQFIYNISHEVSNPLQSVQTNLENMADCSPAEIGRWKQYHTIIKHEMKRLFTLTENLRLLSQLESITKPVRRESVNLKSIIEDVIMAQAERASTRNINLNYQGPNRPAKVLGNRGLLHEVIVNFVDNSIKYAKASGGQIIITLNEEGDSLHVIVTDEGIGIPEEDLPFVFDTAYRSPNTLSGRVTGSGLGLAIVKRIVGQHEGEVSVNSEFGEGTTITIQLPIYNPEPEVSIGESAGK